MSERPFVRIDNQEYDLVYIRESELPDDVQPIQIAFASYTGPRKIKGALASSAIYTHDQQIARMLTEAMEQDRVIKIETTPPGDLPPSYRRIVKHSMHREYDSYAPVYHEFGLEPAE